MLFGHPRSPSRSQGTCCVIRLCCRLRPDDAIGRTNKRGSSVYGKRAQRSALGALRKFCWSGTLQGCTAHGPARADGRPAGSSWDPLCPPCRNSLLHPIDVIVKIKSEGAREAPAAWAACPWAIGSQSTSATVSTQPPPHSLPAHLGPPHRPASFRW